VERHPGAARREVARDGAEIALGIAEGLGIVGLLAVELFLTTDGRVLVNELAPRPHNTYHQSERACATSQFEQLVRAVCGLPLGAPTLTSAGAIANLLGDLWSGRGAPDPAARSRCPTSRLHLYGKREARAGRKMGHLSPWAARPRRWRACRTPTTASARAAPPIRARHDTRGHARRPSTRAARRPAPPPPHAFRPRMKRPRPNVGSSTVKFQLVRTDQQRLTDNTDETLARARSSGSAARR
jgi:5-(carboxyamino)imidazole ribonucleotide synthase